MSKSSDKSSVKKTLVRNTLQKSTPPGKLVQHDVESNSGSKIPISITLKEKNLSQPTLCSSESFANYVTELKKVLPPPTSTEDVKIEEKKLSAQMTKKLNFHLNDRIYKNLVELNGHLDDIKKEKKPTSRSISKKDVEPNIEDFFQDYDEPDVPPVIPTIKPKMKQIVKKEDGSLHRLVSSFDML